MDFVSCFVLTLLSAASRISSLMTNDENLIPEMTHRQFQQRSVASLVRESCLKKSENPVNRVNTTDRLRRLRLRMKASNYDAYVVPSSDEHESEFVADHDKRRQFISGFSGSAGAAVVLLEGAALWTDGRYFLQAESELDCSWLLMRRGQRDVPTLDDWIVQRLRPGSKIGADSKLISHLKWTYLNQKFQAADLTFVADDSNLIDDIWNIPQGRSPESVAHVFIHDVRYAGKTWNEKVEQVVNIIEGKGASGAIFTALDDIAWLFNLRGHDVSFTPVFKAYAFISKNILRLYMKRLKLTAEVEKYLCPKNLNSSHCVQVLEYNETFADLEKVIGDSEKILVSSSSSHAIVNLVPKEKRILQDEPSVVQELKTIKNPVEIAGIKSAALKDSVAIVDFIALLDEEVKLGKHWDEMKVSRVLAKYRREQALNEGESFASISAFGANGAIVHYKPEISTNRNINTKHLYLLDSGGQYLDGTTDITRTFHFGDPGEYEVEAYTRVLMGAIDLITTVFPDNVYDNDLDIFARRSLYAAGLDYSHSTGHGIGSFLGVHEGPISIGRARKNGYHLKPGMILSDEPGFYEPEKFGVRLETMMMVVKAQTTHHFNNHSFYTFEPLSFVPFEPKLIDLRLLSKKQKEWLNWFNVKTRNSVGLELRKQNRQRGFQWLLSKTEYIPVEECHEGAPSSARGWHCAAAVTAVALLICVLF